MCLQVRVPHALEPARLAAALGVVLRDFRCAAGRRVAACVVAGYIAQCFICNIFSLFSALYAEFTYYVVLYMQTFLTA